jgi:hypothetical protein
MKRFNKLIICVLTFVMLTSVMPVNVFASNNTRDSIWRGTVLRRGDFLLSKNGAFKAIMQDDGNFVIYNAQGAIWSAYSDKHRLYPDCKCSCSVGQEFRFQLDGNIVLYSGNNTAIWSPIITDHNGKGADRLIMQNDGNLVAYVGNSVATWFSGTANARNAGVVTKY